jgi:hypothetical protein
MKNAPAIEIEEIHDIYRGFPVAAMPVSSSNPIELLDRPLVPNITGMGRAERLDDQKMDLFMRSCPGAVFDSLWNQNDLPFLDLDGMILETHLHSALHDIEQFIAVMMGVHNEFALDFR